MTPGHLVDLDRTQWRKGLDGGLDGFCWPVSPVEVMSYRDHLNAAWIDQLRAMPDNLDKLSLHNALVFALCRAVALYEASAVAAGGARAGCTVRPAADSPLLQAMMADRPVGTDPQGFDALLQTPVQRRPLWYRGLRMARSRLRGDPLPRGERALLGREAVVALNYSDRMAAHAAETGERVVLLDKEDYLAGILPVTPRIGAVSVAAMVDTACDVAATCGQPLHPQARAHLRDFLTLLAGSIGGTVDALRHQTLPRSLWLISALTGRFRALCAAVRDRGGDVVAHDHGTGEGWAAALGDTRFEMEYANVFVTLSPAHVETYRAFQATGEGLTAAACRVTSLTGDVAPARAPSAPPAAGGGRRLLVLTSLYRTERLTYKALPHALLYTDWHLRLLQHLTAWGWEVEFRPHPEEPAVPPVVRPEGTPPPLSEALARADVVIADYPQSSALIAALRSACGLVIVDLGFYSAAAPARALLEKRAVLLDAGFDEMNRIAVDWDALRRALECAPALQDRSYADAYYPAS